MKKLTVLVVALVALLALGGAVAGAAKKKQVKTKVTISIEEPSSYSEGGISGKVKSKKAKCRKKRKVTIRKVGKGVIGKAKTSGNGSYNVPLSGDVSSGIYRAVARKAAYKKGKTKYVCKQGKSKKVTVPN